MGFITLKIDILKARIPLMILLYGIAILIILQLQSMILIRELYILECLIPKIYYKFYTITLVYFKKLIKKESNLLLRNTEKIFMSLII